VVGLGAVGKPVWDIGFGMQALMSHSGENAGIDCIDVFSGGVKFFGHDLKDHDDKKLKVPHMGWNQVKQTLSHPLWNGIADNSRFYFVHSYFVEASSSESDLIAGTCEYPDVFTAALAKDNLFATQFHPEKSDAVGLQLLKNFIDWNGTV